MYPSAAPAAPAPTPPADLIISQTANGYIVRPRTEPGYAEDISKTRVFNTIGDMSMFLNRHFDDNTTSSPDDFADRTY